MDKILNYKFVGQLRLFTLVEHCKWYLHAYRKPNFFSRLSTVDIHSRLRFKVARNAALNSASVNWRKSFSPYFHFVCTNLRAKVRFSHDTAKRIQCVFSYLFLVFVLF